MPAGWSMQPPTDERPGRVGLSPRAAGGMDSGPATWLHIYILDYLRKKKMVRSAETFCAEAGLDMSNTATQVPGLWEWWLQMWEARVASRAQPAGDMVLRAQQPELSSLGGELGREAPTRVMTEQQIQQLLFLKRKQAQAQAQAQQAAQAQAQAQVQAQVQAQAHAQVHAQTQVHQAQLQARQAQIQAHAQDQDCAAGLLGQQHQQQDMGVSPWGQQAHYLLQQDQRQELLAGMQGGCAARKNSGLPVEVPEGMGRRSDTWVVSNIQDYEQAKRFKLDHGGSNMGPAAGLSPGLAMQQSAQQARMYARMPGHGLVQDKALSDRPMHPGFVPSEAEAACKSRGAARRSSLDSTTNSTGTKVVPVGSGGQSLLSGSLPHGRPVMTFVDHTSGNAQQHAVYPPLNGQQIVGNVGAQQYSPHVRMLQEQRFQAMQQQLQQARGLQGRQYAANGVTPGVIGAQHAAAASYTAAAQGRAQTYASQATLAKPSYGSGMAGQGGQNVVLSPQLSTVGSCGNPGGSAGAAPAKIDETWSSLRQAPRSSQGPMKYSAAAESNNGGTGMVAISQVAQKQDAASMPAMGNSCVPMSSNKTLAPSPQEHAGGPFPSTNGNSSSVASTDGPGASQNGTPESNNPAEKNGHHASLDAVREKGLGPRFENGDTGDLDNGNGLLDADVGNPLFTDVNTGSPGFGADLDLGELCDMGVQ